MADICPWIEVLREGPPESHPMFLLCFLPLRLTVETTCILSLVDTVTFRNR